MKRLEQLYINGVCMGNIEQITDSNGKNLV